MYLNLTLASVLRRSSSCIESQQNAIERVSLWSTHNTQESVINMFNHNSQELFFWPAFYTSIACMTFIHELDIPVFSLFILLTVLLTICLLLSEEAPNFESGVSLGLPRHVSFTNTLQTLPFSLSCCFIHVYFMTGALLDPSFISLMHSKHFY